MGRRGEDCRLAAWLKDIDCQVSLPSKNMSAYIDMVATRDSQDSRTSMIWIGVRHSDS